MRYRTIRIKITHNIFSTYAIKDTKRKIRTTLYIGYWGRILVPNPKPVAHSTFAPPITVVTSFHQCYATGIMLGTDQTSINVYCIRVQPFLSFY